MQQNGTLDISIGRSRRDTKWKQQTIEWVEFSRRLSETHRTTETFKEFVSAKKDRQDEIKDIGGFVGGIIRGGNRTAASVVNRQLITLDIDFAHPDFWEDFQMIYSEAALIYSTHKHCPEAPRLRLLMPLDRPVMADEYQAIARRIAGNLGIECFDQTTFQPERLMYWPSTPKDGEYLYERQDGLWLNADAILDSYYDWRDISQWPVSVRFLDAIKRGNAKLGNPLEKPGIIGAFCRTYSVSEGIDKYLKDVYEKTDKENRYTFLGGSTCGGLVVYDDLFAFSHHGTDPASGRGVNIFDLVRLHKFPGLDQDVTEKTPINKYPSHVQMEILASGDEAVRGTLGRDRIEDMQKAFDGVDLEGIDTEWTKQLDIDRKGTVRDTIDNIVLILENDPWLKGKLKFNAFAGRQCIDGDLPWRNRSTGIYWGDSDDSNLRLYLEKHYGIVSVLKIADGLEVIFSKSQFHPVREYLQRIKWDENPRVETMMQDFLGAPDTDYVRAVARKMVCGAVARVFHPGIKFDTAIILVGPQGVGKSTFLRLLGRQWYSDSFGGIENNRAYEQIQGAWIIEMGELSGMRKAEVNEIKHFMSKSEDTFRPAYARRVQTFARQCIFCGTTNDMDFLQDPTGNRRYWPVNLFDGLASYDIFSELTAAVVDQIWAEAVFMFRKGETLHLTSEIEKMATKVQEEHTEENLFGTVINNYLNKLYPENWDQMTLFERRAFIETGEDPDSLLPIGTQEKTKVCVMEIWQEALKGDPKNLNKLIAREINAHLRHLKNWKPMTKPYRNPRYGIQRGFMKWQNVTF